MEVWSKLVKSKFLREADAHVEGERCKTCNSGRQCYNHFCLLCKEGSLCPQEFKPTQAHHNHPWLQVHLGMKEPTVHTDDLKHFIGSKGTKLIQYYVEEKKTKHCYLRSQVFKQKLSGQKVLKLKGCAACQITIKRSQRSKEAHLVCSLECLIQFSINHPTLQLLEMENGVMGVMEPPLLQTEKQRNHKFNNCAPVTRPAAFPTTPIPTNLSDVPLIEAHESAATLALNLPEVPEIEAPAATATLAAFNVQEVPEIEAPAATTAPAALNHLVLPETEAPAATATLAAFNVQEVPEIEAPAATTAPAALNHLVLPEPEAPAATATQAEGFTNPLMQADAQAVEEEALMFLEGDRRPEFEIDQADMLMLDLINSAFSDPFPDLPGDLFLDQ